MSNSKFIVKSKEIDVRALKKKGLFRKILGPKAYRDIFLDLDVYITNLVKNDLKEGYFIEAYTLTDQYIETVLKYSFYRFFSEFKSENLKFKSALKALVIFKKINKSFFDLYTDFKQTRNDLVHASIFHFERTRELLNVKKVKNLPLKVIDKVDLIFNNRKKLAVEEMRDLKAKKNEWKMFINIWMKQEIYKNNLSPKRAMESMLKQVNKVYERKKAK